MEKKPIDVKRFLKESKQWQRMLEDQKSIFSSKLVEELGKRCFEVAREIDESYIEFLKSIGYRPKLTQQYFENLEKRLNKKGLRIGYDITDIKEEFNENSCQWLGIITWYIAGKKIEETFKKELKIRKVREEIK
mgnify:CR=1 FL=1